MAEQWYCQLEGASVGPIDAAQLQGLVRRGRVTPETLVRTAAGKNWVPAGKVTGLKFPSASAPSSGSSTTPAPAASSATPPSSTTMRAPAALKKAKLLEPGVSPGQVQRSAEPSGSAAGVTPPPLAPGAPPVYGTEPYPPPPPPPPPPPGFDAAPIPAGIPVGIPLGSAVPPAGAGPGASASEQSPWLNLAAAPAGAPRTGLSDEDRGPVDKKQQARRKLYLMFGGVAGVVLILAIVGVILSQQSNSAGPKDGQVAHNGLDEETAEDSHHTSTSPQDAATAGHGTGVAVDAAKSQGGAGKSGETAAARADSGGRKGDDRSAAEQGDLASAMKSVSRWFDMSTASAVTSKTMKLQLTSAWLDSGAGDAKSADDPQPAASTASPPRLFIELRITNTQTDAPLNYTPWNGDGGKHSRAQALLATDDGGACSLVPVSQTKGLSRQSVPVKLKAGQAVTELLVFSAPDADFETLQLLLPTSAVGQAGRYLGLKIPRDRVAAQKPVELADQPEPTRPAVTSARQTPVPGENAKIIANADPAPSAPPKPREETIDDLRKSIVDSVKDKQKERDEEIAREREANKKKPD